MLAKGSAVHYEIIHSTKLLHSIKALKAKVKSAERSASIARRERHAVEARVELLRIELRHKEGALKQSLGAVSRLEADLEEVHADTRSRHDLLLDIIEEA